MLKVWFIYSYLGNKNERKKKKLNIVNNIVFEINRSFIHFVHEKPECEYTQYQYTLTHTHISYALYIKHRHRHERSEHWWKVSVFFFWFCDENFVWLFKFNVLKQQHSAASAKESQNLHANFFISNVGGKNERNT